MEDTVLNRLSRFATGGINKVIWLLTIFVPKFKIVIIQTYPTWEDNGVAVSQYFSNKPFRIVWLIPDRAGRIPFSVPRNVHFVKRNSLKGVIYFVLSKYVLFTHGMYGNRFSRSQISVNMWHGMPLKRIGVEKGKVGINSTFTLSTSTYFNHALSDAFKVPIDSVKPIGLPRISRLFSDTKAVRTKLRVSVDSKLIFWLPTYRKSVVGDIRADGNDYGNAFNVPEFDIYEFDRFLRKGNFFCFLKPHPMSSYKDKQEFGNIKIIDDNWLYEQSLTLYESLSACEILISDISSVLVDFLILDRPIVISFPDHREYSNSRGVGTSYFFEHPPGPMCLSQNEIQEALSRSFVDEDEFRKNRANLINQFHEKRDYDDFFKDLDTLIFSNG